MARADFIDQLRALGYGPRDLGEGKVAFKYTVPVGRLSGRAVEVGYVVPESFPTEPPQGGPHIKPRLHPNKGGGEHPTGGIHDSTAFGPEWHYWSRPMKHWSTTSRDARAVLAFLGALFDAQ